MRLSPSHGIGFVLFVLIISTGAAEAQQKLTPVNYGTITISALHWPYLIAEQEGMLQKEGIEIKRVLGGTTTATSQALVAGSTDFAQMNPGCVGHRVVEARRKLTSTGRTVVGREALP